MKISQAISAISIVLSIVIAGLSIAQAIAGSEARITRLEGSVEILIKKDSEIVEGNSRLLDYLFQLEKQIPNDC
jgi:hypothetical protein